MASTTTTKSYCQNSTIINTPEPRNKLPCQLDLYLALFSLMFAKCFFLCLSRHGFLLLCCSFLLPPAPKTTLPSHVPPLSRQSVLLTSAPLMRSLPRLADSLAAASMMTSVRVRVFSLGKSSTVSPFSSPSMSRSLIVSVSVLVCSPGASGISSPPDLS